MQIFCKSFSQSALHQINYFQAHALKYFFIVYLTFLCLQPIYIFSMYCVLFSYESDDIYLYLNVNKTS